MIEEIYYQDEGYIKVTAASVGISSRRWTCINAAKIQDDNYKSLMNDNRFDILPIVEEDGTTNEFYKTDSPNNYEKISKQTITYKDVMPLDTSIHEVIKGFVVDNRTFYFLTYQSRITGLITLGNLNCRQVQMYIFGLICELERILSDFIESDLTEGQIKEFMIEKSEVNEKWKETLDYYQMLVQTDLENKLTAQLYLIDFFIIIENFDLYEKLGYSKKKWQDLRSINDLRHLVAHPTRSLLNKDNDVSRLWRRIGRIEDLTFRLKQLRNAIK